MIFTVGLHPVFKTPGLKMEGRDHFDPLGPMATAHDMLEHFEDDDGTEEHELLAIGASWWVRNHGSYLKYKGYPMFPSTVDHLIANVKNVMDTLGSRPLTYNPKGRYPSLFIERYLEEARKDETVSQLQDDTWTNMCAWLRAGYEQAKERYTPNTALQMCDVFRSIEDQAAGYLQGAQLGAKCEIVLDLAVPKATLKKVSD